MAAELTDLPGTAYNPDRQLADQIAANTTFRKLTVGKNLILGGKRSFDRKGPSSGIQHESVFVTIDGGSSSRPIKGGPDERSIVGRILVRSKPASATKAFEDGQSLARDIHDAVDQRPPVGYCECRAVSSHPEWMGQDADTHHEWEITVELTVDVTVL